MAKEFLTGNEAFAHAALEAGVRVCAGYPGTPSSEVIESPASCHACFAAWCCSLARYSGPVLRT